MLRPEGNRRKANVPDDSAHIILVMLGKSLFLASVTLGCAVSLRAQQVPAPSTPPAVSNPEPADPVSIQQDVEYAMQGTERLLLDIYQPTAAATKPRPAVVMIHGGSFTTLDKSTMRPMGNFLARSGFVAVSVNYRLLDGSKNRWPAQLDDVQRAVRWLRANAAKYNLDPNHIGAFGHSVGGQLAALLGMEDTRDDSDAAFAKYSSRVQAVVDVSGPSDLLTNRDADGDAALTLLFGGDFTKLPDAWRSASPVFHVEKSNAPFLIVHGTSDPQVPIAQAQELYDKLQQTGVPVTFIKLDDGHTFRDPESRHRLALETLTFFNHYLM
jgi:acetyl esterase/lipase